MWAVLPCRELQSDEYGNRFCWVPKVSHSDAEPCSCGEAARFSWSKYAIGEAYGFRLEPVKTAHECRMKLLTRQIELQVTAPSLPREQDSDRFREVPGSRHGEPPFVSRCKTVLRDRSAPPGVLEQALSGQHTDLMRSGAIRCRSPSHLLRATTFEGPPATRRPGLFARAEIWATADEHRRVHEAV